MSGHNLSQRGGSSYVLMTAAYNEEAYIEQTITSVLGQTLRPQCWVIVSDGSKDRTDEIVQAYARDFDFIRFLRVNRLPGRNFRSKVLALQAGLNLIENLNYDFIGNLDADVTVDPEYFQALIHHFELRPEFGIISGFVHEQTRGEFRNRSSNRTGSVPHAAQLVRRECYQAIGGYAVLKYGGEDWVAQTSAKMKGWRVESAPNLKIFHHRHTGAGDNLLRDRFRLGRLDYSVGSDPVFEVLKCLQRLGEEPAVAGALARLLGFVWSSLIREPRPVSDEFKAFLRQEQKARVASLFHYFNSTSRKPPRGAKCRQLIR